MVTTATPRTIQHAAQPGLAGTFGLAGAGLMVLGAGIWASTGTDIDAALVGDGMEAYLAAAAANRTALVANLCLWIVGVFTLGAAGTLMSRAGAGGWAGDLARYTYGIAVPLAMSAFVAWLALVVRAPASPGAVDVAIADIAGWYAYRADNVATALIVGIAPAFLSLDGRGAWVPGWLLGWGLLAACVGLASFLPYFVPGLPLGLTLAIVPVGLGWVLAASIVLLRRPAR
jgi:hypothetical protein